MAHFAKLDSNNRVTDIVFVDNNTTHKTFTENDEEVSREEEQRGIDYLQGIFGNDTVWKQCSFNTWSNKHKLDGTPFRGNMPEIGYQWDVLRNAFIPPKPGKEYILIEKKLQWTSMADWTSQYKEWVKAIRRDV
jgi:hypothetical protein